MAVEAGTLHTFIRFGMQRKKKFMVDIARAYHGIVLPANILLYQYKSTPTVVHATQKRYFVDPMSYLLGQPYDHFKRKAKSGEDGYKPSFARLMEGHGLTPADYYAYDYQRLLSHIDKEPNRKTFITNALRFQRDNVWDTISASKDLIVDDSERPQLDDALYRPQFVIPPYFLIHAGMDSGEAGVNREVWNSAQEFGDEYGDVFPLLFVTRRTLATGDAAELAAELNRMSFPGYCLWVDDFEERKVHVQEIAALARTVKTLSGGGKPVVLLYGGYLGLAMHSFGASLVCHGLAYGESRNVSASTVQSSGPAPIRYYIPGLHRFLPPESALLLLKQREDLMCECPVCVRVMRGNPDLVTAFNDLEDFAEMHFLWNRDQERKFVTDALPDEIVVDLRTKFLRHADIADIRRSRTDRRGRIVTESVIEPAYLKTWADGLELAQSDG